MFDLSGKLAFVAGSSCGIGKAFAIKLATVKNHVSHILQKLSVTRRREKKTAAEKFKLNR